MIPIPETQYYSTLFPVGSKVEINREKYLVCSLDAFKGELKAKHLSRREEINLMDYESKDIAKINQ